ncbi:class II fructose-bisphosphate aldolase [Streptomyces mangrovisoli]|uniref:Fructose-bisphosphate aldolase n=1 Tax=Streptomyces mangrovisoli TaxID=1428628 RepID=A0A1J4NUL8_9ACTN|nr:class II fructose-bisphosphate aldolase [Streptomyces mangrovisoli]OIJ66035.1 fructose-bisphosphate aldolase [Streptomyces mangrovisoli]
MPLVGTGPLADTAAAERRGLGAFNVVDLDHITAIVTAAERAETPVVLQISENTVRYHGALRPLATAALSAAEAAGVEVSVHLDHATSPALVEEAVAMGVPSVMYDASALPYAENVAATAALVERCHRHGVWVEAELGEIGGKDGVHAPGARTDPAEAAAFVAATGVDALAVAVGTSHAMLTRDVVLDFVLIRELCATVPVPLVLHGSSGVGDADLAEAVACGMTKINISTHLNALFTRAVRAELETGAPSVDPRRYLGAGRTAVTAETARLLRLLGETPVSARR